MRDIYRRLDRLEHASMTAREGCEINADNRHLASLLASKGLDPNAVVTPDGNILVGGDSATYIGVLQAIAAADHGQ